MLPIWHPPTMVQVLLRALLICCIKYEIGLHLTLRKYVSEQVVNHAKSYAIKIPIIFIDQKNDIIFVEDKVSVHPSLLTLVISCLRENMSLLLLFLILQILISLI